MAMRHLESEKGLGQFVNDPNKAKAGLARTLVTAMEAWREAYGDIPFPSVKTSVEHILSQPEASPRVDLRQQTYELLKKVRHPSDAEKEASEKKGLVFLPLASKALPQVVEKDPDCFWSDDSDYVNSRKELRDFVIPEMVVALNPNQLALPDSFNKSRATQLEMIDTYSKDEIEKEFPDAKAVMLPAVGYAQADIVYKQIAGKVLFRDFFARALDDTSRVNAAFVGRNYPDGKLSVAGWYAGFGIDDIGAVPAVVFIQK